MKQSWWMPALLLVLQGASGCGAEDEGAADVAPRFERSCSTGEECPGRKCVQVGENQQGIAGICSKACSSDADCGADAACFLLGGAGASCLSLCSDTEPCEGGLACVVVGTGGERACFVEPVAGMSLP
ncbi:hypothetical protein [Vulgatibacter sp.]|uniref:hypothetical protein n=1 Tax=Vulgatibacter sp. TaxID=1971226 RepID=UPI003568BB4F